MTLWDLIKYSAGMILLVVLTTGISLVDSKPGPKKTDVPQTASVGNIIPEDQTKFSSDKPQGGGEPENDNSIPTEDSFLKPRTSPDILPIRDWDVDDPYLGASAALVVNPETGRVFYEKNAASPLPIASITKLMTGLVVRDNIPLDTPIYISSRAVSTDGAAGNLRNGEELTAENLLAVLFIESSNDAATAFAEYFELSLAPKTLVGEMNIKADLLGLQHTTFKNPSGLDLAGSASNVSSAHDVAKMLKTVWKDPILRKLISTSVADVPSINGLNNHHLVNSNRLLGYHEAMLGGKTGYTEFAGESLTSYITTPGNYSPLITVVLKTSDRIGDTRVLITWSREAFQW